MYKPHLISLLVLLTFIPLFAQNWQNTLENTSKKVVLIEYYEQLNSSESMMDKEKIKRYLTGVLISTDGLIVTSSSLFKASLEFNSLSYLYSPYQMPIQIRVKINGSGYLPAEFIGKDDDLGLAFIKLKTKPDVNPIEFSKDDNLSLGDKIVIVQHLSKAYNYNILVNERLVNSILEKPQKRYLCEPTFNALTDFGLVLKKNGQAIGLFAISKNGNTDVLGVHDFGGNAPISILPFSAFANLIKKPPIYMEKRTVRKKWLGIYMQPYTREIANYYGYPEVEGILVNTVIDDSPAWSAGIKSEDVITAINEHKLHSETDNDMNTFRKIIREYQDNEIKFTIFRKGKTLTLTGRLKGTPISQFLANEASNSTLGFSVKELTQDFILAKQLDFDTEGVWVSKVEQAGWADIAGLRRGDLLQKINGQKITNLADAQFLFRKIHETKPNYISIFLKRRSETQFLFLKTNY